MELYLTAFLFIHTLLLQMGDSSPNAKRIMKYQISFRLANSLCAQRREFATLQTLQPAQKTKPGGEDPFPCITYFKLKQGGFGMSAMCPPSESRNDQRLNDLVKATPADAEPVNCTGAGVDDNNPSSGRAGINPRLQNLLWFYKESDFCLLPIVYPYCVEGKGTKQECNILSFLFKGILTLAEEIKLLKILFLPKVVIDPGLPDYVEVKTGQTLGCNSKNLGRKGGSQILELGYGCGRLKDILHELSHVLGVSHEHQRVDRDNYVTVYEENIRSEIWKYNYQKDSPDVFTTFDIPYNQHSIMHYGPLTGAKPGTQAMKAKDGGNMGDGGNDQYSDKQVRKRMYAACKNATKG